jgi:ABC-2 type transport system permease protein
MKTLKAFVKKEWMEQIRNSRLMILGLVFLLFGIMNPAMAKLTPWLMEMMAETLEASGLTVVEIKVDALTSWEQFFKNVPMALLVFVLLQSNIFTKEYQSGTLILALTKGLERYKVVLAKAIVLISTWTAGYWLCYGVTYVYNAYFWDNSIANGLPEASLCWWLFGVFVICLVVFFSVISRSSSGVLLGVGASVLASYLLGFLPKLYKYTPTSLMDVSMNLASSSDAEAYIYALIVSIALSVVCVTSSVFLFNKKQL